VSLSKITSQWPALLVSFGLAITLSWWVLLGWLVSGPLEHGMRDLMAVASSPNPAEAEVLPQHDPAGNYQLRRWRLFDEMPTGTVKWFNSQKGYGFIQPTGGGGKDVFVHISSVERAGLSSLNEGQQVEYEIEDNRGSKSSAVNLRLK